MSKRAVTISYEMLKEIITKGYMIELVECLEGVPEDAVLVDMFPDTLRMWVVMVFDSENWEGEPDSDTRDSPVHGIVPCHWIKHRKYATNKPYTKSIEFGNNADYLVQSKTPIRVRAWKHNSWRHPTIDSRPIVNEIDYVDMEELT
jgi:hypothetical protein